MKKRWIAGLLCGLLLQGVVLAGAVSNRVTQVATIDALLAGAYDGIAPFSEVLETGDFGLGTVDKLAGELVILDGTAYQVLVSGQVNEVPDDSTTPFAVVCEFDGETVLPLEAGMTYDDVKALLDKVYTNRNEFASFRIDGTFSAMKTRSVPAQEKPYPPLKEVVKIQTVFEMTNVTGTIVGMRCPDYMTGINVPGYHFHFLSEARDQGGHILGFTVGEANCRADFYNELLLKLPREAGIMAADVSAEHMSELIDVIEK